MNIKYLFDHFNFMALQVHDRLMTLKYEFEVWLIILSDYTLFVGKSTLVNYFFRPQLSLKSFNTRSGFHHTLEI